MSPVSILARRTPCGASSKACAIASSTRLSLRPMSKALSDHPQIEISRAEIAGLPPAEWNNVIVATGPLTSPPLADAIRALTDESALAFFDAIAPIVHRDSIDMSVAWFQSRYDKAGPGGTGADYINCPMSKEQYEGFV